MRGCILPVKEWRNLVVAMSVLAAISVSPLHAQAHHLKVLSGDGGPVVYAYVSFDGGQGQITDENGDLNVGAGKAKTFTVQVRRIGYAPWFGKLAFPDGAATDTVMMTRLAQTLGEVTVTGQAKAPIYLQPFYDRWMMRQKGTLSAVFIGPEELDARHPGHIADMFSGLNNVSLRHGFGDAMYPLTQNGTCPMAVLVDNIQQVPTCEGKPCPPEEAGGGGGTFSGKRQVFPMVNLNDIANADAVAAIEVYSRGGNMPSSLHVNDSSCGAIVIWTGSRKP
jgi:hypothetical protein